MSTRLSPLPLCNPPLRLLIPHLLPHPGPVVACLPRRPNENKKGPDRPDPSKRSLRRTFAHGGQAFERFVTMAKRPQPPAPAQGQRSPAVEPTDVQVFPRDLGPLFTERPLIQGESEADYDL